MIVMGYEKIGLLSRETHIYHGYAHSPHGCFGRTKDTAFEQIRSWVCRP